MKDVIGEVFGSPGGRKVYRMTEDDLEEAALESVWYPICPHCGAHTPAEPDAEAVCCTSCDRHFKIDNPWF